jgi:hypothetical protein
MFEALVLIPECLLAPANILPCSSTDNLFDEKGIYLKSVCEMTIAMDYDEAGNECNGMDMRLFQMSSLPVKKALYDFAYPRYPRGAGSVLWVDGMRLSNGVNETRKCMSISNISGEFREKRNMCIDLNYFFCEFSKKYF